MDFDKGLEQSCERKRRKVDRRSLKNSFIEKDF
jgi:hypothetical protein